MKEYYSYSADTLMEKAKVPVRCMDSSEAGFSCLASEMVDLIADALEMIADEDGYAFMSDLGNLLVKKQPDFDPRNFGFSKLSKLVKSLPRFEVDVRKTDQPNVTNIYVRDKARRA